MTYALVDLGDKADLIVVGAGFFGATIAERAAHELGLRVLVIERRDHIGGSAYSFRDPDTGIEVHRYGPHIFHTSSETVWRYVNRFASFSTYSHRVFSVHRGEVYPLPINLATICQFFRRHLTPAEARTLIAEQAAEISDRNPDNLEDKAISLVGRPLYEAFIRGYTKKQWQIDPRHLPGSIIARLPVRYTFDNRYFSDRYEGMPLDGYTAVFERLLGHPGIHIALNTDWFAVRDSLRRAVPIVYTGPIDRYFGYRYGRLGWRTTDFRQAVVPVADYQGTAIMNFADEEVAHTRIIEYRHFHPERAHPEDRSLIVHEYPRFATGHDEPFYPIDTREDRALYHKYKERTEAEPNVYFGGRLGTYHYLDMHQAIGAALKEWERLKAAHFSR